MNRVTRRTWLMGLFVLILMGGMFFFLWDYWTNGAQWIASPGSPHLSGKSDREIGTITDREGILLLKLGDGREYAQSETTRRAMLHWLGDREGKINATAVSRYTGAMVGFDPVSGIYNSGEGQGVTELTISATVQNAALEALRGRKGTVAVYNYKTGEILCAVTAPTYDPDQVPDIEGDTTGAYEGTYLNRFTQVTYTPGSIFKTVSTIAALEYVPGIQDMTFRCTGIRKYGEGENVATVTCETPHGTLSLKTALASSCNCAFAQIAELIGKDNMTACVKKLQVTQPLEFEGITTAAGQYELAHTATVSFAWSCIGQHTDLINPARFMTFMGAIGGGGQAAVPYLVSRVTSGQEETYLVETRMMDRIMDGETASILRSYMRSNVKNVYGDWNFAGMNVCAKSGTSQLGGEQVSNALFAGFVEDEAYPLAFICVVENGGYGAATCVPVLSKVLAACKTVMDAA